MSPELLLAAIMALLVGAAFLLALLMKHRAHWVLWVWSSMAVGMIAMALAQSADLLPSDGAYVPDQCTWRGC